MVRSTLRFALALLLIAVPTLPQETGAVETRVLSTGTRFETPCYVVAGEQPGPTVMIVSGMHGNEPASALAASEIAHWRVGRGRLVVVPRANVPALTAFTRLIPDVPEAEGNLNRHFPTEGEPKSPHALGLWNLVLTEDPDWLLDLHEGYDFRRVNPKTVGSSVIACSDAGANEMARAMIETVDATIDDEHRRFTHLHNPTEGSLARAAWDRLRIRSLIVETTSKDFVRSYRARQHRLMVHRLLAELGMEPGDAYTLVSAELTGDRTRVAVFDGSGAYWKSVANVLRAMTGHEDLFVRRVGSPDIRADVLEQFDVVVLPGGSGSGQAKGLGTTGREAVRSFVEEGGGYLGICAGAYLAACNYDWSLGVLDAQVIDRAHWKRGSGLVDVELTAEGDELFGARDGTFGVQYVNGPILMPGERNDIPDFVALAWFRGEVAQNGAPRGVMPGTAAMIAGAFGKGRAVALSPHPEKTEGLAHFIHDAVLWLDADE